MAYRLNHELNFIQKKIRKNYLNTMLKLYTLDKEWAKNTGLRSSNTILNAEQFDPLFLPKFLLLQANGTKNILLNVINPLSPIRKDTEDNLQELEDQIIDNPQSPMIKDNIEGLWKKIKFSTIPTKSTEGYMKLFARDWRKKNVKGQDEALFSDALFAQQAVAGALPTIIRRFKVNDFAYYEDLGFSPSDSIFLENSPFTRDNDNNLMQIAEEGRLYIQDFSKLDKFKGSYAGANSTEKRYVFAPFVLYALNGNNELLPICIQLRQTDKEHGASDPIFVPYLDNAATYATRNSKQAEYSWELAKAGVSSATHMYHQYYEHLGMTHFLMENVSLSMYRTLSKNHPIYGILRPHVRGTRAINEYARNLLVNTGGFVDQYLSLNVDDFKKYAASDLFDTEIFSKLPLRDFNERDINDLPYYPFRDDSKLLWEAIRVYVNDFLDNFYTHGSDFQKDREEGELKVFLDDLTNGDLDQNIKGLKIGEIETYDALIDLVALLIFTASCQHAAVNFPQGDCFSNVAFSPGTVSKPTPVAGEVDKAYYLEFLPPMHQAVMQLNLMKILSSEKFTKLGHYRYSDFRDRRVQSATKTFKHTLRIIERKIKKRNKKLPEALRYTYLLPSEIPQSVNI